MVGERKARREPDVACGGSNTDSDRPYFGQILAAFLRFEHAEQYVTESLIKFMASTSSKR